jgi:hypothetical protein
MACPRLILTVAVLGLGVLHAQDTPPKDEIFWVDINPKDANQPRFKTYLHQPPKGVNAQCTILITAAQWRQDILVATNSAAHFDNCAFHESVAYIKQFLDEAEAQIKAGKPEEAVATIGRALHGIQDFYAHSNYVEMMATQFPSSFATVPTLKVWTGEGQAELEKLMTAGLISGRYPDQPQLCSAAVPEHKEIAKDSRSFNAEARKVVAGWENRTYYNAALELSQRATNDFLLDVLQRWPSLQTKCGTTLGYLSIVDRRKAQ